MLNETVERLRRPRRHDLDAVAVLEISNHPDLGELVLLLLAVRQRHRRVRLEKVARVGGAAVVKNQRRLLRREAHAGIFRLQDFVQHPRRLDAARQIRNSPILVAAIWIEIMAKLIRRNVLRAEVNAVAVHAKDSVSDRLAEVVRYNSLVIVVRGDRRVVRIADAGRRHQLELESFAAAPDDEAAISVNRTFLGRELHELLEAVPVGYVAVFAPLMEILIDDAIVIAVTGRR